jgi:pyruvate dehydrogenase E2 component (dihydrolipoamide acetyltransferase)
MAASPSSSSSSSTRVFASPLARKLARDAGVDLASAFKPGAGSGPNGRVLALDVQSYKPSSSSATSTQHTASPQDLLLAQNKLDTPHYYLNVDVNFTALLALRDSLQPPSTDAATTPQLSVNDFIIRACAISMRSVPSVNSAWGDAGAIRQYAFCDVNMTTVLGDGASVVAPVIRGVHAYGLMDIAKRKRELLDKDLGEDDLVPGTFSIVDVGAFGVKSIVPIIRPGQAAALGVGVLRQVVVPGGAPPSGVKVETVATLTLSCDHRVVDGAVGAQYLHVLKSLLERPSSMLL